MKIQRKKNQNQMKKFPFERLSELQDKRNADGGYAEDYGCKREISRSE